MKYVHYSCDEVKQMFNQLFPNISEKFDNCEILLKLSNYSNAYTKANNDYKQFKYHVFLDEGKKIFTMYYNLKTKQISYRNELNDLGKLRCGSERKFVESVEDIYKQLDLIILNN